MTGASDTDEGKEYSATLKTDLITPFQDDSEVEKNPKLLNDENSYSITDTIAAIVSAILALVFLIMIVCLIQVIKKRRREQRSNRTNRQIIQTITPQTFGTNIGAYRHVPASNTFSWESVTSSQAPVVYSEQMDEASSSVYLSESTSYASVSSESILVTAILHPPPSSCGLDGPALNSGSALENASSSSSIHIHSNSMQQILLHDVTYLPSDINT
ncbi:hypothetical protein Btru_058070 [Bulinus truncatus]|nr:hypothetical protein Btru_058070 [Bulinus truncatus]